MVIPMPNDGIQTSGPPPPEVAGHFRKIKLCVMLMIVGLVVKFISGVLLFSLIPALFQSMNLAINTTIGIFLLKDDAQLSKVYAYLTRTICQSCGEQCGGSMRCLMPFIFCNLLTVVMDLFAAATGGGGALPIILAGFSQEKWPGMLFGISFSLFSASFLLSFAAQGVGAFFGYQAYKEVAANQPDFGSGGGGGRMGGFGGFGGGGGAGPGGGYQPLGGGSWGGSGNAPPRAVQQAPSRVAPGEFRPFSGQGQTLGR